MGPNNQLVIAGREAVLDQDWRPLSYSGTGDFSGGVVFGGYGIVAPKTETESVYDSYVHLDIKDKWVLVFRFLPENVSSEWRQQRHFYSQLRYKGDPNP